MSQCAVVPEFTTLFCEQLQAAARYWKATVDVLAERGSIMYRKACAP